MDLGVADGPRHLVVGVNNTYATTLVGVSFESIFTHSNEATIISALDAIAADPSGLDSYTPVVNFEFSLSLRNAEFGSSDPFTLVAFSNGQAIGTGSASVLGAAVPEPAVWVSMILGLGGVGTALRRRRASPAGSIAMEPVTEVAST